MLVLSRDQDTFVLVGSVVVRLLKTGGNRRVKLGFAAPANVPVLRGELLLSMMDEELKQEISSEERTALQVVSNLLRTPKADDDRLMEALQHPAVQELLYSGTGKENFVAV